MSVTPCVFASDLHGQSSRYQKLLAVIESERPQTVFLGGDLLSHRWADSFGGDDLANDPLGPALHRLRSRMGEDYPKFLLILGNDDDRASEEVFFRGEREPLWKYLHERWDVVGTHPVLGYAYVPPTPFQLKDWERYDVSRFTDPGCLSPEQGIRTVRVDPDEVRFGTMAADIERLTAGREIEQAVVLFHSPPYETPLDRAALDGKMIDHVPLDVHVGSIAIKRFIEKSQPLLTLHGHIHEAPRLTGTWRTMIGRTHCFTAAHDGPELALVRFDLDDLDSASRELL